MPWPHATDTKGATHHAYKRGQSAQLWRGTKLQFVTRTSRVKIPATCRMCLRVFTAQPHHFTCSHTDQTRYLSKSVQTDSRPTSPSAGRLTPDTYHIRVSDQNGVPPLYIMLEEKSKLLSIIKRKPSSTARLKDTTQTRTRSISWRDTNRPSSFASEQATAD